VDYSACAVHSAMIGVIAAVHFEIVERTVFVAVLHFALAESSGAAAAQAETAQGGVFAAVHSDPDLAACSDGVVADDHSDLVECNGRVGAVGIVVAVGYVVVAVHIGLVGAAVHFALAGFVIFVVVVVVAVAAVVIFVVVVVVVAAAAAAVASVAVAHVVAGRQT
jgi:hypothetical protein